jgi:hypothetical protein
VVGYRGGMTDDPLTIVAGILDRLVARGLLTREVADQEMAAERERVTKACDQGMKDLREGDEWFALLHG